MRNYFRLYYTAILIASVLMIVLYFAYQLQLAIHFVQLPSLVVNLDSGTLIMVYYCIFACLAVFLVGILPRRLFGIGHVVAYKDTQKDEFWLSVIEESSHSTAVGQHISSKPSDRPHSPNWSKDSWV